MTYNISIKTVTIRTEVENWHATLHAMLTLCIERLYSEITDSDKFHRLECTIALGHTLLYVIIAIDDTVLSSHVGDSAARPLYLTLGNFSNASRRQLSRHAWSLVGLLPVYKNTVSDGYTPQELKMRRLWFNHFVLGVVFGPLRDAQIHGLTLLCSDNEERTLMPVIAQCVVDLKEAYTLAGVKDKTCPQCLVKKADMSNIDTVYAHRCSDRFMDRMIEAIRTENKAAQTQLSLRYLVEPIEVMTLCPCNTD